MKYQGTKVLHVNPRNSRKKVRLFRPQPTGQKYIERTRPRFHLIELISPRFSNTFEFSSNISQRIEPRHRKTTLETILVLDLEREGIEKSRGLNSASPPLHSSGLGMRVHSLHRETAKPRIVFDVKQIDPSPIFPLPSSFFAGDKAVPPRAYHSRVSRNFQSNVRNAHRMPRQEIMRGREEERRVALVMAASPPGRKPPNNGCGIKGGGEARIRLSCIYIYIYSWMQTRFDLRARPCFRILSHPRVI